MRTLLVGEGEDVCSGVGEGETDSWGQAEGEGDSAGVDEAIGVGDSCARPIAAQAAQESTPKMLKPKLEIRDLSIVAPIHVRKNIVTPFTVAQKLFIEIICDKLIVQTIKAGKVIRGTLSGVFTCSPSFHQKCPVA